VTEVKFLGERAGAPPGLVHVSTIFVDVTVNQNDAPTFAANKLALTDD